MKKIGALQTISVGLAIFSMFFGAGNLMYPIVVGMESGSQLLLGIAAFILTAVILPVTGLIAMILFDGDYRKFFERMGTYTGSFFILACMLILGPIIAIPRIVTLSHTMVAPFIPLSFFQEINPLSSFVFACIFLCVTFLATYRENRIVDVLGYIISPTLLLSLVVIIAKGLVYAQEPIDTTLSVSLIFKNNFIRGYETLDLIAAIFFSSVVLHILKNKFAGNSGYNSKTLATVGLQASILGVSLLGIIYVGMSFLGVYYGSGLESINAAEIFRRIAFRVLGNGGAAIVATAVLMACLSTSIALAAVVGEYAQRVLFKNRLSYAFSTVFILFACLPLSVGGIETVLQIAGGPLIYVGYPMIITLTFCNILYKTIGFKPIKLPVFTTGLIAAVTYYM